VGRERDGGIGCPLTTANRRPAAQPELIVQSNASILKAAPALQLAELNGASRARPVKRRADQVGPPSAMAQSILQRGKRRPFAPPARTDGRSQWAL